MTDSQTSQPLHSIPLQFRRLHFRYIAFRRSQTGETVRTARARPDRKDSTKRKASPGECMAINREHGFRLLRLHARQTSAAHTSRLSLRRPNPDLTPQIIWSDARASHSAPDPPAAPCFLGRSPCAPCDRATALAQESEQTALALARLAERTARQSATNPLRLRCSFLHVCACTIVRRLSLLVRSPCCADASARTGA